MKKFISAPAPRFIMRFFEIDRLLRRYVLSYKRAIRVAEIGPGLGDVAAWFNSFVACESVVLVESSIDARDLLVQRFNEANNVKIVDSFDSVGKEFDLIMAFEVLEHIEDDQNFLSNIHSYMTAGGLFIGSVPAYMNKWQAVDVWAGHVRRYERSELKEKLEVAGFSVITIDIYGFPVTNALYCLRELYYKKAAVLSRDAATAQSGISRSGLRFFNKSIVFLLLWFFKNIQRAPMVRDFGDGFIFLAKKNV
ncbi:class I SAM-dependent methyltransferase [Halopseudomonas salina]|uniref:Methyltransferase domain-containing protein n=1 Tax=Halopseudomonas salina TaxID=1323744 RepID=A0ABQ1PVE6_9GAMM|nr:class I SAM-dependent methyltransferase [Halopseudomonas salina]GGD04632.1 hypothetical protein GCM10007418_24630 [Halopseudomonas salina]